MKTLIVIVCFLGLVGIAKGDGVTTSADCTLSWDAPTGPVDGYRVFVGSTATAKTQRVQVTATTVPCSSLNLTAGQNYAHVVAFNVAGASPASTTVPFVLVLSPPAAPVNLRVLP